MHPLLAISLLAGGPFIGEEQTLGPFQNVSELTLTRSADATLLPWSEGDEFLVSYVIGNERIGLREVSFSEPPSRRRAAR
jgi:hypothetical protein